MTRSELVQAITQSNPHLPQPHIERIIDNIFESIIQALERGHRVELRGFGTFAAKTRRSRTGRNPRTGETVFVAEKHVPFFRTGKELRARLNGKPVQSGASPAKPQGQA